METADQGTIEQLENAVSNEPRTSAVGVQGEGFDFQIVVAAIATSIIMSLTTELIGWLVVYRHDAYKK